MTRCNSVLALSSCRLHTSPKASLSSLTCYLSNIDPAPMKLQLVLAIASLLFIGVSLALPLLAPSYGYDHIQTITKRSERESRDSSILHQADCGCPPCYERKLQRPRIQLHRTGDSIKKPVLKVLCQPITETIDKALDACEKNANNIELEKIEKQHKKWLKKQAQKNAASTSGVIM